MDGCSTSSYNIESQTVIWWYISYLISCLAKNGFKCGICFYMDLNAHGSTFSVMDDAEMLVLAGNAARYSRKPLR